jgi:signal transduction histidine kinase/ActR/RegA family two-component response regulator
VKRLHSLLLPWAVGLASLGATFGLVVHEQATLDRTLRASFDLGLRQTASRIEQRIASFELMLRGAQGLFRATDSVSDEAFEGYVDALLAGADAAGLQGIGYAEARPDGSAPLRLAAPAMRPNQRLLGFDVQSDPVRRSAMEQARDSGGIAITRKLRLAADPADAPASGFVMVLPVYARGAPVGNAAERRRHHRGWVLAGFRMHDVMASLYGEGTPGLAVSVHDGVDLGEASVMYASHAPASVTPRFAAQEYVGFAGHTWTLAVRTLPAFDELHNLDGPRTMLIAGVGASLLLALLTWQLASGRARAHAVAQAMTRELRESEVRLRESQKMEAIGTLAGGIAHDFNNILAAILGNTALARESLPAGHPAEPHLGQVLQAGAHARSLVQQIVAFSRRQPLARVAQPLAPLLQSSVRLLRATLPAAVELKVQVADHPVWAQVDANQLQQVLMNLCTNAWHALAGGSGRIDLGLDEVWVDAAMAASIGGLGPGPHARLWVADNGCGMDEAALARIFEPFYTTKPVGQGTGLGLSVVHGIVTAHEGAIGVASRPGQGSRFDLYFPLVAAMPSPAELHGGDESQRAGRGERVIYLDDDAVMAMLAEALLGRDGYAVRSFTDAHAALAAVREAPEDVDLFVTDYNMPELSGLDVVRALHEIRPGLPVIISSGFLNDEIRAAAARAGVRHLLQKEYSTEQLTPLVRRVLDASFAG